MIIMSTTVHALRKCMTPASWAKYAQNHGIRDPQTQAPSRVVTDTTDVKKYELTAELQEAVEKAEKFDAELRAMGFTLEI